VLPIKNVEFEKKSNFQFLTAHLGAPTKVKFGLEYLTTGQNSILFSAYSPWCTKVCGEKLEI